MKNRVFVFCIFLVIAISFSCQRSFSPKPHSYFRIDFPEKEYQLFDSICPFTFKYPVYGKIVTEGRHLTEHCWFNIEFPKFNATIHLTYLEINNNFYRIIEENWRMIYSRLAQRADAIEEHVIEDHVRNVFGIRYKISGNTASHVQFFLTDSVKHFVRGSLYFYVRPNYDSLAPVINFFWEDVINLTQTLQWKNNNN